MSDRSKGPGRKVKVLLIINTYMFIILNNILKYERLYSDIGERVTLVGYATSERALLSS